MTSPTLLTPKQIITSGGAYVMINSTEGATLTCGADSYTLTSGESYHVFIVSPGTYVCTASMSGYDTRSTTVTVTDGVEITLKPSRIPSAYQEVEYLRFTGTQYINTDIVPANTETAFTVSQSSFIPDTTYIGTANNYAYYHVTPYQNSYYFCNGINEGHAGTWSSGKHDFVYNSVTYSAFKIDGEVYIILTNPRAISPLYVGLRETTNFFRGELFSITMTNKNTKSVMFNGIPCYRKNDSVAGLYDTVSGTLFTNSGTGTFVVGADV